MKIYLKNIKFPQNIFVSSKYIDKELFFYRIALGSRKYSDKKLKNGICDT